MIAAAACVLGAGVSVLALGTGGASAAVEPGIKPDITVGPGDTVPQTYAKALVGSAEVKGDPASCRNDPVTTLTCATHRIKVNRVSDPTYQLRIILEWDAQGEPTVAQVPDVDMFLFTSPTGSLDSSTVGGAGATAPEQIKITPTEDEYDLVVQAYAGAITSYKLTVSYTNTAGLAAGAVTPDIVLTPHKAPFVKQYDSVIAAGAPAVLWLPDGCRNNPANDNLCDVYRIKLNRNTAKDATNFVVMTLAWDAVVIPGQAAVAVGLVERPVPDLNFYVYDAPDHQLEGIGGASISSVPERLGFVATQDEYDLVVQSAGGMGTSYKLAASMTDEIFDKPFEFLDPITGAPLRQEPDGSITPISDSSAGSDVAVPSLSLAPIDVDDQISGIGLGTTEQFDSQNLLALGRSAMRNTTTTSDPPSAWVLWLVMVIAPAIAVGGSIAVLRRRHNEAF